MNRAAIDMLARNVAALDGPDLVVFHQQLALELARRCATEHGRAVITPPSGPPRDPASRTASGTYTWEPPEEEGGAGVREPRRPKPEAPSGTVSLSGNGVSVTVSFDSEGNAIGTVVERPE